MKLRKNEIISPKNFPVPPWRMNNLHRGIPDFLPAWSYAHLSDIPAVRFHGELLVISAASSCESYCKSGDKYISLQTKVEMWVVSKEKFTTLTAKE